MKTELTTEELLFEELRIKVNQVEATPLNCKRSINELRGILDDTKGFDWKKEKLARLIKKYLS